MTYIAVIDDGNVVEVESLEHLAVYKTATFFFRKEVVETQQSSYTPFTTYQIFKYIPIDINGDDKSIQVGDLVLTNIGPDRRHYQTFYDRPITFYDLHNRTIKEYKSKIADKSFLFKDFKLIIDVLSKCNDWEIFLKLKEYDILMIENAKLKEQVKKLQVQIQSNS